MLKHMFVFGVIIPTIITVLVFLGFLVCWFKLGMREHFHKTQLKKQLKKKLPTQSQQPVPVSVSFQKHITHFTNLHPDDPNDRRDTANGSTLQDGRMNNNNFPQSQSFDLNDADTCSIEDASVALCRPSNLAEEGNYFTNPNMDDCDADLGLQPHCGDKPFRDKQSECGLVQHTFHFPVSECNQLNCMTEPDRVTLDTDTLDDANYGHFVPVSQFDGEICPRLMVPTDSVTHCVGCPAAQVQINPNLQTKPLPHVKCVHWHTMPSSVTQSEVDVDKDLVDHELTGEAQHAIGECEHRRRMGGDTGACYKGLPSTCGDIHYKSCSTDMMDEHIMATDTRSRIITGV